MILFTMNPGESFFTSTVILPIFFARSVVTATVSSLVPYPRITSTSFISGTGLKKCIPQTLSGRLVAVAISVRDMDDVLEARMTFGPQISSNSLKTLFFNSMSSRTTSIMKSASLRACISVVPFILRRIASFWAASIFPFSTLLERKRSIFFRPRSTKSSFMSLIITSQPIWAAAWAIPFPIVPAPTTPTVLMSIISP